MLYLVSRETIDAHEEQNIKRLKSSMKYIENKVSEQNICQERQQIYE